MIKASHSVKITGTSITYKDASGISRAITSTSFTDSSTTPINFYLQSVASSDENYVVGFDNPRAYSAPDTHSVVTLPTGEQYTFYYDALSESAKIVYPAGGYTRYEYQAVPGGYFDSNWEAYADIREIYRKATCSDTSGSCSPAQEAVTTYVANTGPYGTNAGNIAMDVTDPVGNRTHVDFSSINWSNHLSAGGRETNRFLYSGQSTLLRTIHTDYTMDSQAGGINGCSLPSAVTTTFNDVYPAVQSRIELEYADIQLTAPVYESLLCGTTGTKSDNNLAPTHS